MGFLDKAKAAAEQAAAKAKEGVEDVQTRRELSQAHNELGKSAFELIERGEITHPDLEPLVEKIRMLNERVDEDRAAPAGVSGGQTAEPD